MEYVTDQLEKLKQSEKAALKESLVFMSKCETCVDKHEAALKIELDKFASDGNLIAKMKNRNDDTVFVMAPNNAESIDTVFESISYRPLAVSSKSSESSSVCEEDVSDLQLSDPDDDGDTSGDCDIVAFRLV